jgi:DNA-binding response OmpR family regulator
VSATVLAVDDEVDLVASCARLLRRRGWRVETAATRDAALAAVDGARPALAAALLDLVSSIVGQPGHPAPAR